MTEQGRQALTCAQTADALKLDRELRERCVSLANGSYMEAVDIVARAQAFYDFITCTNTKSDS